MTAIPDRQAEQLRELGALGLSAYAARAYLSLLRLGSGEARQVSELARVPSAKVYATLSQLERRGLVTVVSGKPRRYHPVPIGEFVSRRIDDEHEAVARLVSDRARLEDLLPIVGEPQSAGRAGVTTLRGRRNISERFRREMRAASREVGLQLPARWPTRVRAVTSLVHEARSRGVRVRIVRPAADAADDTPEVEDDVLAPGPGAGGEDVMLATFDGRVALLAHFVPSQLARDHPKDVALVAEEAGLVAALDRFFTLQWDACTKTVAPNRPLERRPVAPNAALGARPRVGDRSSS